MGNFLCAFWEGILCACGKGSRNPPPVDHGPPQRKSEAAFHPSLHTASELRMFLGDEAEWRIAAGSVFTDDCGIEYYYSADVFRRPWGVLFCDSESECD